MDRPASSEDDSTGVDDPEPEASATADDPERVDRERDDSDTAERPEPPADVATDADEEGAPAAGDEADDDLTEAELRERVEEKYDFDDFGPSDMAEMSPEEWDAAFDADTWITGDELLDRVEGELEAAIADRTVFAVVEEVERDGQRCLLAYSDEDYALVTPDGGVEGFGTLLRDVKPIVALCSMEGYEPKTPDESVVLPEPDEVPEGSGEFGNLMLQIIAAVQALAGLALVGGALIGNPVLAEAAPGEDVGRVLMIVLGVGFVLVALLLFTTVANARLSDRFRAEQYRERLRETGLENGERPEFLPLSDPEETAEDGGED